MKLGQKLVMLNKLPEDRFERLGKSRFCLLEFLALFRHPTSLVAGPSKGRGKDVTWAESHVTRTQNRSNQLAGMGRFGLGRGWGWLGLAWSGLR
jgi:hypothetical protein